MSKRILSFVMSLFLLAFGATGAFAQQRQVTGTVTGADQAPVSGATVTLTGTRRGVQTDAAGRFTIPVSAGAASLTVSRIGFTSRTVQVPAGENTVAVRLQPDVLNLEAVVVTGAATAVRRENLANAVSVVTARNLQAAPAPTMESALQGKVAGANISANSGAPGGGMQIQLRGVSTISGNPDPLYIIDGVIMSNAGIPGGQNAVAQSDRGVNSSQQDNIVNRAADINPNDIESIEVLKGASASAIYGARAANGVIIIRTKRGRAGAPRFNVTQRFGYSELANQLGARTWTRETAAAMFHLSNSDLDKYFAPAAQGGAQLNFYDNEKAVFGRRAPARQTQVSMSGGTQDTRYYVAGTAHDEEGIALNTGYEKQAMQLNLDHNLNRRITVGVGANVTHSVASRGVTGNDNTGVSYYSALSFTPSFIDIRQKNGVFPDISSYISSNPAQTAALATNDENTWRAIASGNVQVSLLDTDAQTLRFTANGGVDYFQQRNELYFPSALQFEGDDDLPGTAVLGVGDNTNLNGALNLVHTFTPASNLLRATTSLGVSYTDEDLKTSQIVGRNTASAIPTRAAKIEVDAPLCGGRCRTRDFGVFGQEELLLFNERMTLTGGVRAERSSNNADAGEYFFYPKVASSYRFNDVTSFLDEFKLRAAYGAAGNRPAYGQRFTPALGGRNINGVPVFYIDGAVGDANLRPERTTEVEGGFDATLFGGRARFEATAYHKTVSDFIIAPPVAPSTGYGRFTQNNGEYKVEGLEAMLEATPVQRGDLNWVTRTTFTTDRAEVTRLDGITQFAPPNSNFGFAYGGFRIKEGVSPTAMWGLRTVDGVTSEVVYGDASPKFRMGFSNEVNFRRFTVAGLLDWAHGGLIANLTRSYYDATENLPLYDVCNTDPDCDLVPDDGNGGYIEDAGYVKLREISVAYSLPENLFQRFGGRVNSARISLSGRNLKTWTSYTGLDPEVSNFGNRAVGRNIDVTPFPPSRTFWLSFDLGV